MYDALKIRVPVIVLIATFLVAFGVACTTEVVKEVPGETVYKEIIKEVPVEKEVIKEIITEKIVTQEKEVPVEKIVTKEVEVPVEKIIQVDRVIKEIVIATPMPADTNFYATALDPNYKRGGTLITANNGPPGHWDFYAAGSITWHGVMQTMYDKLLRPDTRTPDMTIVPDIGTSWEISSDQTEWTFQIRDGVRFHDGSTLTGHDVKATFDRIAFPSTFGEGLAAASKGIWQSATLQEITATDSEVKFILEEPKSTTHMMAGFTDALAKISSKANLEANNGNMKNVDLSKVSGSGPFKFVEQTADHFVVDANTDYWNPNAPYIDRVETIWIKVFSPALTAAIQTGKVDWAIATAPPDDDKLRATPGLQNATMYNPFYWHIMFNSDKAPFNDVRMRKAVALVVEPEAVVTGMNQALGSAYGGGWFPQGMGMEEYSPAQLRTQKYFRAPTAEDVAEAKALLAEAGYPEGATLPKIDFPGRNNAINTTVNEIVQAMLLQHLGWESEIRLVDVGTWRETKASGDFHMGLNNALYTVPVPEVFMLDIVGSCDGVPCSTNLGKFQDSQVDELFAKLKNAAPADKYGISVELGDRLDETIPYMPMTQAGTMQMWWHPHVKGFAPNGSSWSGFYETVTRWDHVWLDK